MVSQEAYERYNKWLFLALERYWKEDYQRLVSSSPEEKYKALMELRNTLERSAVMHKRMKAEHVPAKKIYRKLYRLVFRSHIGKKCMKALKKGDEADIEEYESKLLSMIESYLYHADFDLKFLKKDLRKTAEPIIQRTIETLLKRKEFQALKPAVRIAWSLMLVLVMNFSVSNMASAQELPEPSEKVAKIMDDTLGQMGIVQDSLGKQGVWNLTYGDLEVIENPVADAIELPSGTKVYNYSQASPETRLALDHFRDIQLPPIMIITKDDTSEVAGEWFPKQDSISVRQKRGKIISDYQKRMGILTAANHDYSTTIHEIMHHLILKTVIKTTTLIAINSRLENLMEEFEAEADKKENTGSNVMIRRVRNLDSRSYSEMAETLKNLTGRSDLYKWWNSGHDEMEDINEIFTLALVYHLHPELMDAPNIPEKMLFEAVLKELLKDPVMRKLHS